MLVACTGGGGYFDQLWLLGLVHAVYWLNRTGTNSQVSPFERVWTRPYEVHAYDHVFGSLCMYHLKDSDRPNKGTPQADPGIWVGRDLSTGGHRVPQSRSSDFLIALPRICKKGL